MAVSIRLSRRGTKKRPFYRIVVADKECPRDGKFLEVVGTYNPLVEPPAVTLEEGKIRGWIGKGAVPSTTVRNILKTAGFSSLEPKASAETAKA